MNTTGLPMAIRSEDGVLYQVDVFSLHIDNLRRLWDKFSKHAVLFCDQNRGNATEFLKIMLRKDTIVLSVGDVGVFYATELIPGYQANVHYFFWDLVSDGRQKLILSVLRWGMDSFDLHRATMLVPRHAYAALHRIYRMGIRIEGIEREAQLHNEKWYDVLRFGILRSELTNEALKRGRLERVEAEQGWFGLLKKDVKLMEYIMRRSG